MTTEGVSIVGPGCELSGLESHRLRKLRQLIVYG